jgi:hypothetical protein
VLDSLRSISRSLQHGENDPEIGATLYDLKQAVIDAGGTLVCNKAADLVGTEALSGHNAIAGAANTVLTLHYVPGDNGQPNKTAPERRLFREARSGDGFDLVIGRSGNGFNRICTFDRWQEQAKEASQTNKAENITPLQQRVKEALEAAATGPMTRRQVCDAVGEPWSNRGRNTEARRVDDALRRLVELGLASSVRAGTEATYSAKSQHPLTNTPGQPGQAGQSVISMDLSDSDRPGQHPDNPDNVIEITAKGVTEISVSGLSGFAPDTEIEGPDSLARLSGLSGAMTPPLAAEQQEIAASSGSGWDAFDDGEDPHWPPSPDPFDF